MSFPQQALEQAKWVNQQDVIVSKYLLVHYCCVSSNEDSKHIDHNKSFIKEIT